MEYYIRLRGQQQGPFSAEQLQKLATRGRFSRHFEVSADGQSWRRAELHPELFPAPPAPRPRPAPSEPTPAAMPASAAEAPVAMPVIAEPADADQWYYTHGGSELGPVGGVELKRMIGLGQVVADDHVWLDGMENWHRVRDVPELARQLSPAGAMVTIHSGEPGGLGPTVSGLAITSFVMGLLGITVIPCLASVFAVVFGHMALSQIHHSAGRRSGGGLAITGLILGYLVIIPTIIFAIVYVAIAALAPTGVKLRAS